MTSLKDLRERRGRIVSEMRGMLDAAGAEKRDLSTEEQARYDAMFAEQEGVADQIGREERQQELDRRMAEAASRTKEKAERGAAEAPIQYHPAPPPSTVPPSIAFSAAA